MEIEMEMKREEGLREEGDDNERIGLMGGQKKLRGGSEIFVCFCSCCSCCCSSRLMFVLKPPPSKHPGNSLVDQSKIRGERRKDERPTADAPFSVWRMMMIIIIVMMIMIVGSLFDSTFNPLFTSPIDPAPLLRQQRSSAQSRETKRPPSPHVPKHPSTQATHRSPYSPHTSSSTIVGQGTYTPAAKSEMHPAPMPSMPSIPQCWF